MIRCDSKDRSKDNARICGCIRIRGASVHHLFGVFQKLQNINAHDGGGHHAEIGKSRIASANAWHSHEDFAEFVFFRDTLHLRAGISDGDKAVAYFLFTYLRFHAIKKVLFVNVGLEGAAGFARDDADGAGEVHLRFNGFDLRRIGGIQDVKVRIAGGVAKSHAEDFRTETRAAHSEKQSVLEGRFLDVGGDLFQFVYVFDLLLGDIKPAQPFAFVSLCPQRGIFLPKPLDFAVLFPILKRRIYMLCEFVR